MRRFIVLAAISAVGACASPAASQDLWRGARAGMSVEEVLAIVPGAHPGDGTAIEGKRLGATVTGLAIANKSWNAKLYFGSSGLGLVVLEPDETVDPVIYTVIYEPTLDDLREAYGEPFVCERGSLGRSCEWRAPDKIIRLSYLEVGSLFNLSVSYEVRGGPRPPL